MKILVDGLIFQFTQTGIARIWSNILPRLSKVPDVEIFMLNRGGSPSVPGVRNIDFPSYTETSTAADSFLIDQIGAHFAVDGFVSTYYTSPISIPSVLMVYDMIPEILNFDLSKRIWQEKEIAISFARRFVCISASAKTDLLKFYPEVSEHLVTITKCGIDQSVFHKRFSDEIAEFRKSHDLEKPYYMLAEPLGHQNGYKDSGVLLRAAAEIKDLEFDIVCVGGDPEFASVQFAALPSRIGIRTLELSDDELAQAYSGALALVFPSLYEGFGVQVIEAIACECPVISNKLGWLGEIAADAVELVSSDDVPEMVAALQRVRRPDRRAEMIGRGLADCMALSWDSMAETFLRLLKEAVAERYEPPTQRFFAEWKRLREIQAAVDTSV